MVADYSQLGDFEVTTPIADLLQEIEAEGVPTTKDQVIFNPVPLRSSLCICNDMQMTWQQATCHITV